MHPLLKRTLDINDEIEILVSHLAWDQILKLSQERDFALREYVETTANFEHDIIVAKILTNMNQSKEKISHLIKKNKMKLIGEGLSLKNSHHAIQQYHHTQAD